VSSLTRRLVVWFRAACPVLGGSHGRVAREARQCPL
jgi:hypothetical protein